MSLEVIFNEVSDCYRCLQEIKAELADIKARQSELLAREKDEEIRRDKTDDRRVQSQSQSESRVVPKTAKSSLSTAAVGKILTKAVNPSRKDRIHVIKAH